MSRQAAAAEAPGGGVNAETERHYAVEMATGPGGVLVSVTDGRTICPVAAVAAELPAADAADLLGRVALAFLSLRQAAGERQTAAMAAGVVAKLAQGIVEMVTGEACALVETVASVPGAPDPTDHAGPVLNLDPHYKQDPRYAQEARYAA